MHIFKNHLVRAIIFVLVCVLLNQILVFVLMPTGSFSRLMLHEMYTDDHDFDIVFSGSSLAFPHFDPEIIDEEMDVYSFNTGTSAQAFPGNYSVLKEMFAHHKPKMVVLTTEWVNYILAEENTVTYLSLVPYIENPLTQISYLLNSGIEGSWLNRIFLWKGYHVNSIQGVFDNIKKKLFDQNYLEYEYLSYPSQEYKGRGYVYRRATENDPAYNPDTYGKISRSYWDLNDVNPHMVTMFEKIVKLCNENNCELILVNPPRPKIDMLSVSNYFEADQYIADLAERNDVEYYNFNLVKPEFLDIPDEYYYDHSHMMGDGATLFSHAFAQFLRDRETGKDVNLWFYTPDEYLKSIDYVTNVWFTYDLIGNLMRVQADSLQGIETTPEYQFTMYNQNGDLVLLKDYSLNSILEFATPPKGIYTLRVNARAKGSDIEYQHYYEEIIEFSK